MMTMSLTEWPKTKVKDLAEYITVGFVGSMSHLFCDDGVPLLRGQNIKPYSLDLSNLKFISLETHRKWKKSALLPGDVAIVRVGYPGTACVIPEGVGELNAASLVIVRPDKRLLDSNYLCYVINSPWGKSQVLGRLVGSAQQVFNTQTAADLEIPAPPLPTQRKIAGILSAYDDLIENNLRRIKILEEMAQSLYREWFVHFRFPGHESVSLVNSSPGSIPEGWEVKVLGEIAEFRLGKMLDKEKNKGELMPYLANVNVRWGRFELDELREMRFTPDELDSYGLRGGDIVMCEGGEPGRCAVWNEQIPGMMIQKAIHRIRCRENMNHSFLYQSLLRLGQGGHLASLFTGATIKHLPREQLAKVKIVVPPKSLLDAFIKFVRPAENQVDVLASKIQTLRRTRDLLLPKLLNPI
jgi:type I restriction enzyme S subunit